MKGLNVDYENLSAGIIRLIDDLCEKDENYAGALMLGMLPAPIMDYLERDFKRRVFDLFEKQQGFSVDEGNEVFKQVFNIEEYYKIPRETVSEFMRTVTVKLLNHYSKEGKMIV